MSFTRAVKDAASMAGYLGSAFKNAVEGGALGAAVFHATSGLLAGTAAAGVLAAAAVPVAIVIGGATAACSLIQSNTAKSAQFEPQKIIIYAADSEEAKELIRKESASTPVFMTHMPA